MTETTETPSATPAEDPRADNKNLIFAALAEAGIHRVTVDYDGSGDSGQIESIEAWDPRNERIPFPSNPKIQLASDNPVHPLTERTLEAAVETLAWEYLEIYYGWENNDGAFGTFVFNVPGNSITLEHRARFTDVDISTHQF